MKLKEALKKMDIKVDFFSPNEEKAYRFRSVKGLNTLSKNYSYVVFLDEFIRCTLDVNPLGFIGLAGIRQFSENEYLDFQGHKFPILLGDKK